MANKRKYIVQYYGWLPSYGDWDCDDFIIEAINIKEARKIMNERLKNILLKSKPFVQLLSTYERQMENWKHNQEVWKNKVYNNRQKSQPTSKGELNNG
tara:strand:+ start:231 stop:524 length:294 start_codon:yes stop_codon:yes gene_type:complete